METFSLGLDNVRAFALSVCGGVGGVDVHDGVTNRRCLIEEEEEDGDDKFTSNPQHGSNYPSVARRFSLPRF